jgi:glycerol uptake facilitator-like aquaporin
VVTFRSYPRVFLAKVLGTFLLLLLGVAAVEQVVRWEQLKSTIFGSLDMAWPSWSEYWWLEVLAAVA